MSLNELLFSSFTDTTTASISLSGFFACIGVALVLGLFIAGVYTYKSRYTQSFVITLAILPAVVTMVILMVNGNIGTGVAVAGTFSLVRFRSAPGTAKEIGAIFLAMGAGLTAGMGYLGFAVLFVLIISGVNMLLTASGFGQGHQGQRILTITMPEDLDYTGVFDDIFQQYTDGHTLSRVKTVNMGSLFKMTYEITLKPQANEKAMMDDIRCRNGNLEIVLAQAPIATGTEL